MIRFIAKTLLRGLLLLALIPLVLGLLLASETVNRWLFEQATRFEPRLELNFVGGQLWRGWDFAHLYWRDEGLEMRLDKLSLAWSPECLWGRRLCIDHLEVDSLHLLIEGDDSSSESEPVALPDIRLPLGIQLDRLYLGSLWLNEEQPLLRELLLAAHMSGDHLVVHKFSGIGPEVDWQLDADMRLSGEWPLRLHAEVNLPPVDERDWQAQLRLGGSLAQLTVELASRGYLQGRLSGTLEPLQPELPVAVEWTGEPFLALQALPPTLTLNDLSLNLAGDMEQGFNLLARARLPGEGGDVALRLAAKADLETLQELDLELSVVEQPQRRLALQGRGGWAEQLVADATLVLEQAFPWQWLYPQDIGPVVVQQLTLDAQLAGESYQAELKGQVSALADQVLNLSLSLDGTPERVDIAPLNLETAAGSAQGEVALNFADGIAWAVELLLDQLDPGVFVAELPGSLSGPLRSEGQLRDNHLQASADWALEGTLRAQPLALSGQLSGQDQRWTVNDLLLRQGDNRISGNAEWGPQVQAALDIQMPRLNTLWPGLRGNLQGQLQAAGPQDAPVVELELTGQRLAYDELSIPGLELQSRLTLSEQLPGELKLTAQRIVSGDTRLGNLELNLAGNRAEHQLQLTLERGLVDLDAQLTGQLTDERWEGRLGRSQIASEELVWDLSQPALISYRFEPGQLRLSEHCWAHAGSSSRLCFSGEQRLMPDRQLRLSLNDFPLESLQHLLPEDFSWDATLNAEVDFRQAVGAQPLAQVQVSSRDGAITVASPEQTLRFPYDRLELNTVLEANQARSQFLLSSEDIGRLDIQANIDDPGGQQRLNGRYAIEGLRLDFLRPFLPQVETLRGELNGNGLLTGQLTNPQVDGVIVLRDGQIAGPELPISLEQLGIRVRISGQHADVDGDWRSGEQGQGSLTGMVTWAPELDLQLSLRGTALPVRVDPYADLSVSPDLRVSLADNRLQLRGQIAIPQGNITIRELPEQAVQLSPDAVIVGQEVEDDDQALAISARVQLLIGDQLRFSGFGLTGRLSGRLEVEENLTASGDLNILGGQYRGYGQRLTLRRAQILFAGPISQPFLNIEAIRQAGDVVAGLRLTGRAESPQSEVFSEPAMAQEQALSYLILGRPLGGGGDDNMLGQAALALGLAGSAPMAQSIASSLGIEGFQLETEGTGLTTQVVAAGYLTDKLSLRYGVGVFEPANQLGLRYELTRRLYLEAVSGFASSLDFFYRIDF